MNPASSPSGPFAATALASFDRSPELRGHRSHGLELPFGVEAGTASLTAGFWDGCRELYYQFVLNCVDTQTGEIVWSDLAEIREKEYEGIFGG